MEEVEAYPVVTEKIESCQQWIAWRSRMRLLHCSMVFVTEFVQNEIEKKYHRDIVHNVLSGMLGKKKWKKQQICLEIHS